VTGVEVATGVIEIEYGNEANQAIVNETLQLVPFISADNSISWRCGGANDPTATMMLGVTGTPTGGTLAGATFLKYLPSACRP
jgi:hypothetical protein